jgi:hypothetical protein
MLPFLLLRREALLLLTIFFTTSAVAQTGPVLFAAHPEAQSAMDINEPLYNGKEHVYYHPSILGIPYYLTAEWQPGTLVFNNVPYKDAFLKYDLVADELVLRHVNGLLSIVLFTPRVQQFTLGDRMFVNMTADRDGKLKAGFYELLASGKLSLYAKRSKWIEEKTLSISIERKFLTRDNFYVYKVGQYYQVKNPKALFNLLGDRKSEVKAWFKDSHIRFKDDPGVAFTKIVEHYNQTNR